MPVCISEDNLLSPSLRMFIFVGNALSDVPRSIVETGHTNQIDTVNLHGAFSPLPTSNTYRISTEW